MGKTKIALVWPGNADRVNCMPLPFAYLKSNTDESKYDIKIIDCTLDNIDPSSSTFADEITKINPEIVGVSAWSTHFPQALTIFNRVKQVNPSIITVLGGSHASSAHANKVMGNEVIDFAFRGEAEFSFSAFLNELKRGSPDFSKVKGLVYRESARVLFNEIARIENLDDIKIPDYDFINFERYIENGYVFGSTNTRNAPIWATRGCPYRCAYCCVSIINGAKLRKHSLEYLMNWIKLLYQKYDIRGFSIIDDNFTLDIEYAKSFCREVIKLAYRDIQFLTPVGIRMERGDNELWSLMREAGWYKLTVAPESGSKRVLRSMGKYVDLEKAPNVAHVVKDIKKAGLKVKAFFIIGYPGETREDLKETELLIRKCEFDELGINYFEPLPGTPVYEELVRKKEITDDTLPKGTEYEERIYFTSTLQDSDVKEFRDKLQGIAPHRLREVIRDLREGVKGGIKEPKRIFHNPLFVFKVLFRVLRYYAWRLRFILWK